MEGSNKDLFKYYCDIAELPATEQKNYIESLKAQQPEFATKLEALVKSDSDLTQVFSDAILDFTDEENLISVGDRLTNYKLTQALGNGGMGQVFKAERCDGKIDQSVAIKFLHPLFYQYQSGKLLLQEAQALAQLNHPNIASIYDIAETDNGNAYIIMEYVEGVTLDVYLQQNDLSVDKKLKLFNQIADAVLEAHNHQIIHADIKPSNVLITASGQAKLIDFGVMQLTGELTQTAPKLVTHYLCAMTVNYASPEQLNGKKATISSDIYGLGGLLYFMLSGNSPFEDIGGTLSSKIEHINNELPEDCAITGKVIFKSDIIAILHKALEKQLNDRYRTATDLINDIQAFQQSKTVSVTTAHRFHNSVKFFYRNRIINIALVSIFIVLLGAFVQINNKNQQITKEKQSLENVNEELKRTFSYRDKTLAQSDIEDEEVYLPDPNKLEPEQYAEIMMLMFDSYFYQGNATVYTNIIKALEKWLLTQNDVDELTRYLIGYRAKLSGGINRAKWVNYEESEQYLKSLTDDNIKLDERVIDLLLFKSKENFKTSKYFLDVIQKLSKDIDLEKISVERRVSFYEIKGSIHITQDFEKAVYYYEKAYQLAKNNPDKVKLWVYVELVSYLNGAYREWKGPNHSRYDSLNSELIELINKLNRNSKFYIEALGEVIRNNYRQNIESLEKTFEIHEINFLGAMGDASYVRRMAYRYYSIYLGLLGRYAEAERLATKVANLVVKQSGEKDSYFYYFFNLKILLQLEQGDVKQALTLIDKVVMPYISQHESLDYLGYYQTEFCYRLALIQNTPSLKRLCFDGFSNLKKSSGIDNYWTAHAASGVVAWYSLQSPTVEEKFYVELLEKGFDELTSKEKIRRGFILEQYYISRMSVEKASHYQRIVEQAMDDYYGSVDAINRYYHQIMSAELALLNKDSATAKQYLSEVKVKLCGLGEQNPHRIKYIKLTKSLNMRTCDAI